MGTIASALAAVGEVSALAKDLWRYLKGGQTRQQETTQDEAAKWVREFSDALHTGDLDHANAALDQLRLLRDKTIAKQPR